MIRNVLLAIFAISACSPVSENTEHQRQAVAVPCMTGGRSHTPDTTKRNKRWINPVNQIKIPELPFPAQPRLPLRYHTTTRDGIRMHLVSFDDRDYSLQVADQPGGTGSRWTTAKQAGIARGAVAAINGGFFTPEGKPLGMLIESGKKRGHINRSSLGAGIYLTDSTRSAIIRREVYQKSSENWRVRHLLQTGPMLAENKRPVSGLSKNNRRPRSFIAWDGKHHWTIGYAESCSLDKLSQALANRTPGGFEISVAVNLDGGRSSDLWVGTNVPGGNKSHRGFFNKPVRNYLVLKSR